MYVSIITVKVKTPEGYKPRSMTFKFGHLSDENSPKLRDKIIMEHKRSVKKQLEEQNPGVEIAVTASMETFPVLGFGGHLKKESR